MKKPKVKLTGDDGNVFILLGKCTTALKKAGQPDKADQLTKEVFACKDYGDTLRTMEKYCDVY